MEIASSFSIQKSHSNILIHILSDYINVNTNINKSLHLYIQTHTCVFFSFNKKGYIQFCNLFFCSLNNK